MAARKRERRAKTEGAPHIIRKYHNRRLYNTTTGAFVTLEDLRQMVVDGEAFVVEDAKSGRDITPSVLAQIIAEQHGRGESVLPGDLMRKLIAMYDNGMSESFFKYLQDSMEAFSRNWPSFEPYNELSRRNMEMFRKSYETFFGGLDPGRGRGAGAAPKDEPAEPAEPKTPEDDDLADEVSQLQRKLDDMQKEIERLRAERGEKPRAGDGD